MFSSGSPRSVNRNGLDIVQIVRSVPYIEYKEREKLSIQLVVTTFLHRPGKQSPIFHQDDPTKWFSSSFVPLSTALV